MHSLNTHNYCHPRIGNPLRLEIREARPHPLGGGAINCKLLICNNIHRFPNFKCRI